jgi:hypothetical protein
VSKIQLQILISWGSMIVVYPNLRGISIQERARNLEKSPDEENYFSIDRCEN